MNSTTISISDLRKNVAKSIDSVVKKGEPLFIIQRSKPRAVLADADYFNALEEAVLDLSDSKEAEKAKTEKTTELSAYIKSRWGSNAKI